MQFKLKKLIVFSMYEITSDKQKFADFQRIIVLHTIPKHLIVIILVFFNVESILILCKGG